MQNRWKPSVTVAAIIEQDGRFLLIEEDTRDGMRLNTPSGHIDPGENPLQACTRETLEEAAYDFQPTDLVGIYLNRFIATRTGADTTYIRFAFCGTLGAQHIGRPLDTGVVRTLWMTLEEIRQSQPRHRSPLVLQCIEDYVRGIRYPMSLIQTHESVYAPPQPLNNAAAPGPLGPPAAFDLNRTPIAPATHQASSQPSH